jgi:caffeoyl-CoA O-methyltransferase
MARPVADPQMDAYAANHSTPMSDEIAAVARSTVEFSGAHEMMVGSVEGRFLNMLVAIAGARHILEVGTFTGYSAISMAEALPSDGHVTTLEFDERHANKSAEHIEAAGQTDKISIVLGPAIDSLATLEGPFDLAFIDADKASYPAYYEAILPMLSPGGLIVADNVLQSGRVLDASITTADNEGMRRFNDMVVADPRVEAVMLTIRDGVTLIRRRD